MSEVEASRQAHLSAVAALEEPTRRRLYDHVVRQAGPVSRDEAAAALLLPRSTAAFHLDRLVAEGLLDVVRERRTGRSGPGAGRPAKLYRRSGQQITVSLPERRYDLAGELLAAAVEEAEHTGEPPRTVLNRRAHLLGRQLGAATPAAAAAPDSRDIVRRTLAEHGFEPRQDDHGILLANCPFHALAQEHTELVCGMNLRLLTGLLDGLAVSGLRARLDPEPGHCCVRIELAAQQGR